MLTSAQERRGPPRKARQGYSTLHWLSQAPQTFPSHTKLLEVHVHKVLWLSVEASPTGPQTQVSLSPPAATSFSSKETISSSLSLSEGLLFSLSLLSYSKWFPSWSCSCLMFPLPGSEAPLCAHQDRHVCKNSLLQISSFHDLDQNI